MARGERENFSPPAVGGSSLLIVFAVLALTIFALLSLSTVRADARLSEASAKSVADYYAADCAAQEILARLRQGERPADVSVEGDVYSYDCAISDTQTLQVAVRLNGTDYEVIKWQATPTGDWTPIDDMEVWDGETGLS